VTPSPPKVALLIVAGVVALLFHQWLAEDRYLNDYRRAPLCAAGQPSTECVTEKWGTAGGHGGDIPTTTDPGGNSYFVVYDNKGGQSSDLLTDIPTHDKDQLPFGEHVKARIWHNDQVVELVDPNNRVYTLYTGRLMHGLVFNWGPLYLMMAVVGGVLLGGMYLYAELRYRVRKAQGIPLVTTVTKEFSDRAAAGERIPITRGKGGPVIGVVVPIRDFDRLEAEGPSRGRIILASNKKAAVVSPADLQRLEVLDGLTVR
jgi:hypothetical protein